MSNFQSESMGRRIARLRVDFGFTQQQLASRLAISRNAVSHMETELSQPSERTVVLLAGVFRMEPHDLVAGTDYPRAKADRLPLMAARYTLVEARLLALDVERRWIARLDPDAAVDAIAVVRAELSELEAGASDPDERRAVRAAQREVAAIASRHGRASA
ncbi:MAG: helix-turn-helix transcriptional regulator [Acidimicrobiia bacterium]|nr:helix-turn-helix transcriptional regulator [Acidimicrobiia bacterium]